MNEGEYETERVIIEDALRGASYRIGQAIKRRENDPETAKKRLRAGRDVGRTLQKITDGGGESLRYSPRMY